jgi:N6-L-threonylcarbamoyladenine synthase
LLGHIASAALSSKCRPPFLSLLISGGHTVVYKVVRWDDIRLICETSDDACGEAFDKTAKILGLGYPGGVRVEELAEKYSGENYITFVANPSKKQGFSYSGLKTAVLTYVNKKKAKGEELDLPLICASFQREVAEELVSKCVAELKKNAYRTLCVCGGVSANKYLRTCIKDAVQSIGAVAYFPEAEYCTDNAAMIGSAAILGARFG